MNLLRKLGSLDAKSRSEVCISTIYNLMGYFDNSQPGETITKKIFEEFIKENIVDEVMRSEEIAKE